MNDKIHGQNFFGARTGICGATGKGVRFTLRRRLITREICAAKIDARAEKAKREAT